MGESVTAAIRNKPLQTITDNVQYSPTDTHKGAVESLTKEWGWNEVHLDDTGGVQTKGNVSTTSVMMVHKVIYPNKAKLWNQINNQPAILQQMENILKYKYF